MLGLYVSDHPLNGLEPLLVANRDFPIVSLINDPDDYKDGAVVRICGLVTSMQKKTTKQGNLWAIVTLEDLAGSVNVLFFPQNYQTVSTVLNENILVSITGRLRKNEDDSFSIHAIEMVLLDPDSDFSSDVPFIINVNESSCSEENILALKDILTNYSGSTAVKMRVRKNDGSEVTMVLGEQYYVNVSSALLI